MRRGTTILLLLLLCLTGRAQHYVETGVHGGVASLLYHTQVAPLVPDGHAGIDVLYHYRSPRVAGVRVGLSADWAGSCFRADNYTDNYTTLDVENDLMEVDYRIGSLTERHQQMLLSAPVQLSLNWRQLGFYVGPRISVPVWTDARQTQRDAALAVTYPAYGSRVDDSRPVAAGNVALQQEKVDAVLPVLRLSVAAEVSWEIQLSAGMALSIGAYADYGLYAQYARSITYAPSLLMLTDTRDGLPLARLSHSVLGSRRQGRPLVESPGSFDAGLKLSLRFMVKEHSKRNNKPKTDEDCDCEEVRRLLGL